MKSILLAILLVTCTQANLQAEDLPQIPIRETTPNSVLVGWRPKEAGIPFADAFGTDKTILFGEKGDIAIVEALKEQPERVVLGIVPIMAPTARGGAVCGAWIFFAK